MSNSDYWFFRRLYQYRYIFAAAVIILLAAVLRLYQLGQIPSGITWDEAAIGYNGHSVITTRRDEWLEFLPVSFRSFGDYKAPLAIYLNGVSTTLLGLTPLAVRLPFALSGIAGVAGIMLLINNLWQYHPQRKIIALLGGGVLALSPWHLHFTRAGFESGLALTLVIWGSYFFLTSWDVNKQFWKKAAFLIAASLFFVASIYTYHSAKLFTPLWVLFLSWHYRQKLLRNLKAVAPGAVAGLLATIPFLYDIVYAQGLERAGVTLFSQLDSKLAALQQSVINLIYHFSPQFLVLGQTNSLRHGDGTWGVLLLTTATLFVIGASWYVITLLKRKTVYTKIFRITSFFVVWLLLGLLPAAISQQAPHSNRSLLALPGFIGLAIVGFIMLKQWLEKTQLNLRWRDSYGNNDLLVKTFLGVIVTIHIFLFAAYFQHYLYEYPAKATDAFNEGYLEAMQLAAQYEEGKSGYPQVSQVVVSRGYGQPVIYTLFAKKISPIKYHQGFLVKYLYVDEVTVGDLQRENSLIVATAEDDVPLEKANHQIYGSDGQIRFGLFLTKEFN